MSEYVPSVEKIEDIKQAKLYAESPTAYELKCPECGYVTKNDKEKSYELQSHCWRCNDQMMGLEWNGWYNRWRDLALYLLKEKPNE